MTRFKCNALRQRIAFKIAPWLDKGQPYVEWNGKPTTGQLVYIGDWPTPHPGPSGAVWVNGVPPSAY